MNSIREEKLFELALEKPVEERAEFLDAVCGDDTKLRQRVEALLAAHDQETGFLPGDGTTELSATLLDGSELTEGTGTQIGRYKLLEKLGEGGFGSVWAAEQRKPVRRRVALKIIKLGMDTKQVVARFEAERQALALMDHPNIAKVLDAGSTDTGRPYFVMELVKGMAITKYCNQEKLDTNARLDLFIKVCHAIQHAHQKGIIHRDIKPSNVMITLHDGAPVPMVIDFGIAKATQQELTEKTIYTQYSQFIGTPAYMSPEQAEMSGLDIDTRSDIYSLGVLLYELLTGSTPFDSSELMQSGLDEMRKIIREREPVRPSTRLSQTLAATEVTRLQPNDSKAEKVRASSRRLLPQIPSDLDWIAMKCLEKDRQRRYDTANALSMDLKRHLNNEPVLACPPSASYRFQKAWRRNKLVYTAGIAVAAALVIGISISVWQATIANRERRAAETSRVAEQEQNIAAQEEAKRANQAEQRAKDTAKKLRKNLYLADMSSVQQALQENNLGRAVSLVEKYFSKPGEEDLRGLEWRYLWQLCQGDETYVLDCNYYAVNAVAFSPNGRLLAMTSLDNKITILDAATKQVLTRLNGSFNTYNSQTLAFSPDGTIMAAVDKGAVNLWRTGDWQVSRRLESESFAIGQLALAFSPDGRTLAVAGRKNLSFWDVSTGRQSAPSHDLAGSSLGGLAYSPSGETLALAKGDTIQLLNVQSRSWSQDFTGGMERIISLAWSSQLLAAVNWDGDLKIWDLDSREEVVSIKPHSTFAFGLAFSPDGTTLVTGGGDQKIYFWDVSSLMPKTSAPGLPQAVPAFRKVATLQGHLHEVWALAFSPDGQTLASGSKDGTVRFWGGVPKADQRVLPESLIPLRFSQDGSSLLTVNRDSTLSYWDTRSKRKLRGFDLDWDTNQPGPFAVSSDGRMLAAGMTNGVVELWNLDEITRTGIHRFSGGNVSSMNFSPNGNLLLGWSEELVKGNRKNRLTVVNLATGHPDERFGNQFDDSLAPFALSPDENLLAAAGSDYSITVQNLATPEDSISLKTHTWRITSLVFSPDGKTLMSASIDNTLSLWDTATWQELDVLRGHMGGVRAGAFSRDGRMVASVSADQALKLWNISTVPAQELLSLRTPPHDPLSIMFSPDNSVLAVTTASDRQGPGGVLILRAPSWSDISTREKTKAAEHGILKR